MTGLKMSKERRENLEAMVANLRQAEDKTRAVRQDLEAELRNIIHGETAR